MLERFRYLPLELLELYFASEVATTRAGEVRLVHCRSGRAVSPRG